MDGDLVNDEIDVWPEDSGIWSDSDGDGYADQGMHSLTTVRSSMGKARFVQRMFRY